MTETAEHLTVRPVVVPANMHDNADILRITKHLYTEQRGRVVGNTRDWDSLTAREQDDLCEDIEELMVDMRRIWSFR